MTTAELQAGTPDVWNISPVQHGRYALRLNEGPVIAYVDPKMDYAVKIADGMFRTQYELHILMQRIVTLVEAARTDQRGLANDYILPPAPPVVEDTQCQVCRREPLEYAAWGTPCDKVDCQGTFFKASQIPVRA